MVPGKIGKLIGKRVRDRRKTLKLTQKDLERRSGIPQGTISRVELGQAEDIHVRTLLGLAKALEIDPADLLENVEDEEEELAAV